MRAMWRHCTDERGIASVMAIFIMVLMLVGIDTIVPGGPTCATASTSLGTFSYSVAAGPGADANCFLNTTQRAGYSIGSGTGYNPGGFVFYDYAITGSGTGPRSAQRTIDAQVAYGPVAQ